MRQIIQIAIDSKAGLLALCDDGTVWIIPMTNKMAWQEIIEIPQPEAYLVECTWDECGWEGESSECVEGEYCPKCRRNTEPLQQDPPATEPAPKPAPSRGSVGPA